MTRDSAVTLDRNGLEVLDRETCLGLLATQEVGRVAFTSGALPVVLPVDYVLIGDRIVIRTSPGSSLDSAVRQGTVVAFEVDNIGVDRDSSWSVVVTGKTGELSDPADIAEAKRQLDGRWVGDGRFVDVSTELLSGRRR